MNTERQAAGAIGTLSWRDANGNWNHLFAFEAERLAMVEDVASSLARAIGIGHNGTTMRILIGGRELLLNGNGAFREVTP